MNLAVLIENLIAAALFPEKCLYCQKQDSFLCDDCLSLIDISQNHYCLCQKPQTLNKAGKCSYCKNKYLNGLYNSCPYSDPIIKRIIFSFKYEPFAKKLAKLLAKVILHHFSLLEKYPDFSDFLLIPVPLEKSRWRWRGFNQAEELTKEIFPALNSTIKNDILIKSGKTPPQANLDKEERFKNISGSFFCQKPEVVKNGKILLIDDVYTTGATMEECAKVLKQAGARQVWGLSIARG